VDTDLLCAENSRLPNSQAAPAQYGPTGREER